MTNCLRGCGEMGCCHPNLTDEFIIAVEMLEGCGTCGHLEDARLKALSALKKSLRPFADEAGGDAR